MTVSASISGIWGVMDKLSALKDDVFPIFPLWTGLSSPNKFCALVSIYFYQQRSDVFGKGSDGSSGPAWQSWLHLILESCFGSKDRTWPSALKKKEKKNKNLCERKRDTWSKFLLLSQNKSSLEDYHDIILFLRQPCEARWETPLLVTGWRWLNHGSYAVQVWLPG